ncbi:uncharacterized protein SOCEGT47_039030 [Sorangium cellulosum]|uniref:RNA polymerase sigma-70 region 2 domain-containing protein n=2 Tax=Sorangium cellulosum TaxID=56 RepID=A0A4P2Q319_SORCE|nr:uncharacterized protein SOCEGT47_039030 [Sorangium cellulosum]
MLRFLGVAEDDLDDLCQDVLLGAFRSLPRYDPMRSSSARAAAPLDSRLAVRGLSCRRDQANRLARNSTRIIVAATHLRAPAPSSFCCCCKVQFEPGPLRERL